MDDASTTWLTRDERPEVGCTRILLPGTKLEIPLSLLLMLINHSFFISGVAAFTTGTSRLTSPRIYRQPSSPSRDALDSNRWYPRQLLSIFIELTSRKWVLILTTQKKVGLSVLQFFPISYWHIRMPFLNRDECSNCVSEFRLFSHLPARKWPSFPCYWIEWCSDDWFGSKGGLTRDEEPITAVKVRSGDVVLMAGRARYCYHGVPRIFSNTCPEYLTTPDPANEWTPELCEVCIV